eukprot:scaffold853_cov103-Cylindrotheca_fusiformis.AAC.3
MASICSSISPRPCPSFRFDRSLAEQLQEVLIVGCEAEEFKNARYPEYELRQTKEKPDLWFRRWEEVLALESGEWTF